MSDLSKSMKNLQPFKLYISLIVLPYGHQTWQSGNLPWGFPTYKITWAFANVFLLVHLTSLKHYISTIRMSMTTKVDRIVTYLEVLLSIELLTLWPRGILKPSYERVMSQLKPIDITLTQCLLTPNFVGWWHDSFVTWQTWNHITF